MGALLFDLQSSAGVYGLPMLGAVLFACAALLMKRTSNWGIDTWRVSFVCNVVTAIAFQTFYVFDTKSVDWTLAWQPILVGALYVLAQALTLLALTRGELSVAAPVLGLKILFVPIFLWLLGQGILPASTWTACFGATLGVALLNANDGVAHRHLIWFSMTTAAFGAAFFALFDVAVQTWSPNWGPGLFLPAVFQASLVISLGFIPLFQEKLSATPRNGWVALLLAAMFFALQALAIVCSVALWKQVAISNVVYSSRGLWSLFFVWLFGSYLQIADQSLTPRVLLLRTLGAFFLLGSIVLLLT